MSRSKRKYLFQNDQNTLNGALLAGNNSMAEMLLWSLVLLPPVIGVYGAGVCFINIGLFVGTTFAWLFLVKRLRSYRDLSRKTIGSMWEFLYDRYRSVILKDSFLVVWLLILLSMTAALLEYGSKVISKTVGMEYHWVAVGIVVILSIYMCILGNKVRSVIRSIFYIILLLVFFVLVISLFMVNKPSELLDIYGKLHMKGGTSVYLNILYYNGTQTGVTYIISMVGMGLGCLGLPFLFNGAFEAKDSHELDRGRVLSILYTGVMIVVISVWSLLNAVCIYPLKVTLDSGLDELLRTYVAALCHKLEVPTEIRYVILGVLVITLLCLTERIFAMSMEVARGLLPKMKWIRDEKQQNVADIGLLVILSGALLVIVGIWKPEYQKLITVSWEYASAMAAPCILAVVWRAASRPGIFAGLFTGLAVCSVWYFVPMIEGNTLAVSTELSAGTASFVFALAVTIIVSMFTHKKNEAEKKLFDQIKLDQR